MHSPFLAPVSSPPLVAEFRSLLPEWRDSESFVATFNAAPIDQREPYCRQAQSIINILGNTPAPSLAMLFAITPLAACEEREICISLLSILLKILQESHLDKRAALLTLAAALRRLPFTKFATKDLLTADNISAIIELINQQQVLESLETDTLKQSLTALLVLFNALIDVNLTAVKLSKAADTLAARLQKLFIHKDDEVGLLSRFTYLALGALQGKEQNTRWAALQLQFSFSMTGNVSGIVSDTLTNLTKILPLVGIVGLGTALPAWAAGLIVGFAALGTVAKIKPLRKSLKEKIAALINFQPQNVNEYYAIRQLIEIISAIEERSLLTTQQTIAIVSLDEHKALLVLFTQAIKRFSELIPFTAAWARYLNKANLPDEASIKESLAIFDGALKKATASQRKKILTQLYQLGGESTLDLLRTQAREKFNAIEEAYFTKYWQTKFSDALEKYASCFSLGLPDRIQSSLKPITTDPQKLALLTRLEIVWPKLDEKDKASSIKQLGLLIEASDDKVSQAVKASALTLKEKLLTAEPQLIAIIASSMRLTPSPPSWSPTPEAIQQAWQQLCWQVNPGLKKTYDSYQQKMLDSFKVFCHMTYLGEPLDNLAAFYQHYYVEPKFEVQKQAFTVAQFVTRLQAHCQQEVLPSPPLYLCFGRAGSGKSMLLHTFAYQLFQSRTQTDIFPILIRLNELNTQTWQNYVTSWVNLLPSLANQGYRFIVLLDAFDEYATFGHEPRLMNQLKPLLDYAAVVVISCREELRQQQGERWLHDQFQWLATQSVIEVNLSLFGPEQIQPYLIKRRAKHADTVERIQQYLLDPSYQLEGLLNTPLGLNMAMVALQAPSAPIRSAYDFYEQFFSQFLNAERRRFINSPDFVNTRPPLQTQLIEFLNQFMTIAEALAVDSCLQDRRGHLPVAQMPAHLQQYLQPLGPELKLTAFFMALPLWSMNNQEYQFKHQSFYEFLVARAIVRTYLGEEAAALQAMSQVNPLTQSTPQTLLWNVNESGAAIMRFLANKARNNPADQAKWFRLVQYSRKEESKPLHLVNDKITQNKIKTAAANAFTILNWAGVSFSQGSILHSGNQDIDLSNLQGVRMPGADGSHLIAQGVNLSDSNIKRMPLQQSFLRDANTRDAKVHDINFGERAYWELNSTPLCMAFSPDGQLLAVGLEDGTIVLYSWPDGRPIKVLKGHKDKLTCLAWQGTFLVSGGGDQNIRLWETVSGDKLRKRQAHIGSVMCLAWQREVLASGGEDNTIRLWSIASFVMYRALRGHTNKVRCLVWQGERLASGSDDNTIRLWNTTSGTLLREWREHKGSVTCLAWHPDGKRLVSGDGYGAIRLWDTTGSDLLQEWQGHEGNITCLAWQGEFLVSGGDDQNIRLWDTVSGSLLQEWQGHEESVTCLAWQEECLASGSKDNTIRLWDTTRGARRKRKWQRHTAWVMCLAWQGERFASGNYDNTIRLWSTVGNGGLPQELAGHRDVINCLAWQGERLVSGSWDKMIRLWDTTSSALLREWQGHTREVTCLTWHPDGKRLASGSMDGTIRVWDTTGGGLPQELPGHKKVISCLAWQGEHLASGSWDNTIRLWDTVSGSLLRELQGHIDSVRCLAWHPDSKRLASGSRDKTIRLWDTSSGAMLQCFIGHKGSKGSVVRLHWLANAAYLLSWSQDGEVILWHNEGRLLERRHLLPSLTAVAWQGSDVVTGDYQGRVCYWRIVGPNTLVGNSPRLPNWTLQWVRGVPLPLDVAGMNIAGTRGLNKPNYDLLRQRGIQGTPSIACRYCKNPTVERLVCTQCSEYFCPQHGEFRDPVTVSELPYSRCFKHP